MDIGDGSQGNRVALFLGVLSGGSWLHPLPLLTNGDCFRMDFGKQLEIQSTFKAPGHVLNPLTLTTTLASLDSR